jgi:putative flippase GtrA
VRNQSVLRSGLCGVTGTVLDVAVLVALVEAGSAVPAASFVGAAAGAAACYLANKRWAFRDRSPVTTRQLAAFGLVAVGAALLMALAMTVTAVAMGIPYLKAKAISGVVVFLAWSYPLQRRFVFRPGLDLHLDLDPARSLA